jgi:hypothetical protein
MSEKETVDKKASVLQVCALLFPQSTVMFTPMSMLITGEGETLVIDENNFEYLQAALSEITCMKTGPMDQTAFNPESDKAKEIAEKLMRGR